MIVFGLFQKVVIADNLSYLIDSAYEGKAEYTGAAFWWLVTIAFSFQIYNDFCGYSLIARGLAKVMGFHFKMNFDHPYHSKSLREFWTKWHISLSTWFRDYVYIPMGGSRKGMLFGLFALFTTMSLSGLWYGANYTFIIWALIHIFFLAFERITKWNRTIKLPTIALILITFIQANIAWIYFRADTIQIANEVFLSLFDFGNYSSKMWSTYQLNITFLILAVIIDTAVYFRKKSLNIKQLLYNRNMDVLLVSLAIILILFFRGEGQQFIYFQF